MSELIDNEEKRRELLKHLILQLHEGVAPEAVKKQLVRMLGEVPYDTVVAVEQELISEGLPAEEVLKLCDVHTEALKGAISQEGAKTAPPGHPVHTFQQENRALMAQVGSIKDLYEYLSSLKDDNDGSGILLEMRGHFNALADVEKHYQRKENLLFPFLEKKDITGPPKVMWGKHDEVREQLKAAQDAFAGAATITTGEVRSLAEFILKPASTAIEEMVYKEEQILLPMCLDTLTDAEWYQIDQQSLDIGFCLYDPVDDWEPEGIELHKEAAASDRVRLASGSFTPDELTTVLNTIPFDMTFVDKDDTVRYFTQGRERIFHRSRSILGRKVQLCHPPSSVHVVQEIIDDFRSGRRDEASFWITLRGRFILIEYYALRDSKGEYLGVLEVSQDLTEKRKLEGERRLLKYDTEAKDV